MITVCCRKSGCWSGRWFGLGRDRVLSLSSTAIVLPLLVERRELSSRFGRGIFGILMLQDLAVGPLLVVLPSLRGDAEDIGTAFGESLLKAVIAAVLILGVGRWRCGR